MILVGKTFGIGNAILSIPMVKSLAAIDDVDVLVGSTSDDYGSWDVFQSLRAQGTIRQIWINSAPLDLVYQHAVMSIPFDGRWKNGKHFSAESIVDGRKRPGDSEELGFHMWRRHEVLYQMENAWSLGFTGKTPDPSFVRPGVTKYSDRIYLGLGHKRDAGGFGRSKHWGNSNYVTFIRGVLKLRPRVKFVTTGSIHDYAECIRPIAAELRPETISAPPLSLRASFDLVMSCVVYFGNDTGMMHAAASMGIPCYGMFLSPDLIRKNHPWGSRWRSSLLTEDPVAVAKDFVEFLDGKTEAPE